ncbi:metalloregulator ArsR/SmtB family transcription factor [Chitinophaga oryziterrae]|uniref:Metalloregulator ArsR/SmtB family transcription factor n=1 Tax=Chitinophaga oryziterrae TaxID=1031224 RepID=A0A6N8JGA1_9BACT|nr:metalloregulator ArsR/SmtB family transcription factor [Chitinophaga oryziterrae]MVT43338.1 metalloregulator ArsR/SmtB family transcription factor [Chitinophaga oryziterrae]
MKQALTDPFQAIADPSRRQILQLLSKDSLTINTLAENFDMSRPAVSKHIKILHSAGFIAIEDIGRERYCILRQEGFHELQGWIDHFDKFWNTKLKKLEDLLNKKAGK